MPRSFRMLTNRLALLLSLVLGAWTPSLPAGEFAIVPLRVDLDRATRSAEVTVRNDDKAPLRMQVEAMAWRQDADGRDRYESTDGLIYFPRALELAPGESRIVRIGVRAAPVSREETYRLFIEQLPAPGQAAAATAGASLLVLLRIGVPVFVAPAQIERRGQVTQLEIKGGQALFAVANVGNVHFVADRVELVALSRDGSRLHAQQYPERYFLAGVTKPLLAAIPRDICPQVAALEAIVVGDGVDLRRKIDVGPGACN